MNHVLIRVRARPCSLRARVYCLTLCRWEVRGEEVSECPIADDRCGMGIVAHFAGPCGRRHVLIRQLVATVASGNYNGVLARQPQQ